MGNDSRCDAVRHFSARAWQKPAISEDFRQKLILFEKNKIIFTDTTDKDTDKYTDEDADKDTHKDAHKDTDKGTDRDTGRDADKDTDEDTDKDTDKDAAEADATISHLQRN